MRPVNPLRHLLLVAALVLAQLAAGVHAVEHAAGSDEGLPGHACQLCLTAQDLGAALPSIAQTVGATASGIVPEALPDTGRSALPAPTASQRGPPAA